MSQRVAIQSLGESELRELSRATLWRARKTGWVRAPRPAPKASALDGYSLAQFRSEYRTALVKAQGYAADYPRWITADDLEQEGFLELLKNSGKPEITKPGFRVILMTRRLKDLKLKRREAPLFKEEGT